ncbi:MAG: hypothetical protein ABIS47_09310 [Acidimicrobiales bacterium]
MSRKALATIGSGPMERVLDQALPTFAEFAERHRYDLVTCRTDEHAEGRPPSWGKVRLIRGLLDRYDVVLWLDADAIILDSSLDPADLLGPGDYQALVCLHQLGQEFPTCGVWLLRSTAKAKAFLDAIWTKEEFTLDRYWEQAAALDLLGYTIRPANLVEPTEWTEGTLLLGEEWNRMPLITRTLDPCRIRHYAGERNVVRRRQMRTDNHVLAAQRSRGWLRRWHQSAAGGGLVRWRLWDAPLGTFGKGYRLGYGLANAAHRTACSAGLVTIAHAFRKRRRLIDGRASSPNRSSRLRSAADQRRADSSDRGRDHDLLADVPTEPDQNPLCRLEQPVGFRHGHIPSAGSRGSAPPRPADGPIVGGPTGHGPDVDVAKT